MTLSQFRRQVYFCFVASRKDSSLHSSWRDFEAGIAKCTGNDGPWRRYEWIYGMAATGVAGAPRLWPRSSAFSSSRYYCTVSRLTIYISNAYAIRRFPSCPLSSSPNRSCNFKNLLQKKRLSQRAARPRNFLRQKKTKIFFYFSKILKFFRNF